MENIDGFTERVARGIGQRVREVREANGLSQQAVADALTAKGYPFSRLQVTKTESATRPITVADLAALAVVLGVPVTYFFQSPDDEQRNALDREALAYESSDAVLEDLQQRIATERAAIARQRQQLQARRAALGE